MSIEPSVKSDAMPTLPLTHVYLIAANVREGTKIAVSPTAMRVDPERHCWIDPFSKPEAPKKQQDGSLLYMSPVIMLERLAAGFRLDLTFQNAKPLRPFDIGPKPEPKHGVEWVPIVEIIEPHEGTTQPAAILMAM